MRPALRILGFARRAVIAFQIAPGMVRILRIFYGGRDRETVFS
jgi:plasmid stabilization system protein ParE